MDPLKEGRPLGVLLGYWVGVAVGAFVCANEGLDELILDTALNESHADVEPCNVNVKTPTGSTCRLLSPSLTNTASSSSFAMKGEIGS